MRISSMAVMAGLLACVAGSTLAAEQAQVQVSDAWARETLPGQKVGAVYMKLKSPRAARVVGVETSAGKWAEIHEMRHQGDMMKMRRLPALDLPAGRQVALEPNGVHIMLMELQQPLKPGEQVTLSLDVEEAGRHVKVPVVAPVRALVESVDPHRH